MEDPSPPPSDVESLPAGNADPGDPLRPEVEEENATPTPPPGAPDQDMETTEPLPTANAEAASSDEDASRRKSAADDDEDADLGGGGSDDESALSDVDEDQFQDFNPEDVNIEDRPVAIDETNVALLGVHKRKRAAGAQADGTTGGGAGAAGEGTGEIRRKKKKGDKKGEKPKRKRRLQKDDGDNDLGGGGLEGEDGFEGGRKKRKSRLEGGGERRRKKAAPLEDDEMLSPEERRKRALDRAMDEALKNPNTRRRKKDGIDLEAMADAEIEDMRVRMTDAAKADADARAAGQPAMHKLKMLPEVVTLLNRNSLQSVLVDPDTNLLEAVRFFLEPLTDGSLPAYNIQRELFAALAKLPISKDALVASGIGKVTLFYTKSNRPEVSIKRQAEKLLGEWTRPILNRTSDFRKRNLPSQDGGLPHRPPKKAMTAAEIAAQQARERLLAKPNMNNRARVEGGVGSYSVVPKSNVPAYNPYARPPGARADDPLKKLRARQAPTKRR